MENSYQCYKNITNDFQQNAMIQVFKLCQIHDTQTHSLNMLKFIVINMYMYTSTTTLKLKLAFFETIDEITSPERLFPVLYSYI